MAAGTKPAEGIARVRQLEMELAQERAKVAEASVAKLKEALAEMEEVGVPDDVLKAAHAQLHPIMVHRGFFQEATTRAPRASGGKGSRSVDPTKKLCNICGVHGHDSRNHRGQTVKEAFTKAELERFPTPPEELKGYKK